MASPGRIFSVLIAAHDAERWLAEAVASVRRQALPEGWNVELLVGVDGCPATARAAANLAGGDLAVIVSDANHGTYIMFNTLMPHARGEIIARFDADDVMRPGYLRRHIGALRHADLAMSWSIYTDADLRPASHVMAHEYFHPVNGECRRGSEGQVSFRRAVWRALGAFRPWRCAADTDFLHRATAHGFRIAVIEDFLYYRRTHRGSLTMRPATRFGSAHREACTRFLNDHMRLYAEVPEALRVDPVTADTASHG